MHYVKQFDINGVATKQVACIELRGKPNAATEGCVGVLGVDVDSPTHDVYKCVAVNGGIYTWELLSSGMSIISTSVESGGAETVQFPYVNLLTPTLYVVKKGDLVLDVEGYLYQIDTLDSTYCVAKYCGTQIAKYGKSAYDLAVKEGFEGSEEEWVISLKGETGDSGVYVGSEEPTNPGVIVWVNPDGDDVFIPGGEDYVKNTDYATETVGGVVKVKQTNGLRVLSGTLDVCAANKSEIDSRTPNEYPLYMISSNTRLPITPAMLDYAVKVALSNCKIEWTDEEKAAALGLLGAVGNTEYGGYRQIGLMGISGNALETGVQVSNGLINIFSANKERIDAKANGATPLVPKYLDYAVKVGVTTNTIELTDEEKAAAQAWLGVTELIGDISTALDQLHTYAQSLVNGGAS